MKMSSASSTALKRVVVYIKNRESVVPARFADCLVRCLGSKQLWTKMKLKLCNNMLVLYNGSDKDLEHQESVPDIVESKILKMRSAFGSESVKESGTVDEPQELTSDCHRDLQQQVEDDFVCLQVNDISVKIAYSSSGLNDNCLS